MTITEHLKKKNQKPDGREYWSPSVEYGDAFFDCKILAWETVGSYQGDYFAMVEKDGQFGFVVIGYGSCSG